MAERNSCALKVIDAIFDKDMIALVVMGCLHGALRSLLRVPADWLMDVRMRTSSKFEQAGLRRALGLAAWQRMGCL